MVRIHVLGLTGFSSRVRATTNSMTWHVGSVNLVRQGWRQLGADREKAELRRRDVDITSELFRLQRQAGRRAMAWDAAFELVRASVGAPDSDRYRLVTQKVIEEIVRHLGEVAPETEEEIPRLTAALADPTAVLIATTLVATCLAEQVAGQTSSLVDEAISWAVTRVATEGKRSVS